MRRSIFQTARTIHAWAGIVLSLILAVMGLSGAMLVFKDDYLRATVPEARAVPDLRSDALADIVLKAQAAFGPERLRSMTFGRPGFGLHKAYLTDGAAAYFTVDGTLLAQWSKNGRIEDWLLELHHRLLAGTPGAWTVGFAGIVSMVFLAAGLVAFWPARRGLRRWLTIGDGGRPALLSLHRNLGVIAAPTILLAVVTGSILTFPATSRDLFDRFGAQRDPVAVAVTARGGGVNWRSGLAEAGEAFPDAALRMVVWPREGGPASVRLRQPAEWHPNGRTLVQFDSGTGRTLGLYDAVRAGAGREAYNAVYPLHAVALGGRLYDAVMAITGLAMTGLGMLGAVAFAKRARWRRAAE